MAGQVIIDLTRTAPLQRLASEAETVRVVAGFFGDIALRSSPISFPLTGAHRGAVAGAPPPHARDRARAEERAHGASRWAAGNSLEFQASTAAEPLPSNARSWPG